MFNTNDLNFGHYNYHYAINIDNNLVNIDGSRMGVLCQHNDSFYDLITGLLVEDDDILMLKEFKLKDTEISYDQILHIFKSMEKFEDFKAVEIASFDSKTDLSSFIPSSVTFKASESNRAISDIFKEKYVDNSKQHTLSKITSIFKK